MAKPRGRDVAEPTDRVKRGREIPPDLWDDLPLLTSEGKQAFAIKIQTDRPTERSEGGREGGREFLIARV